jgi:glycosyltransferase involved in cell wall biosynthesis
MRRRDRQRAADRQLLAFAPRGGGVGDSFAQTMRYIETGAGWTVAVCRTEEEGWPVRTAIALLRRHWRELRSADAVHVEFGSNDKSLFWVAVLATALSRRVLVVAHDFPLLVNHPAAGLLPVGARWRMIVAHRVLAPLLDRACKRRLLRGAGALAVFNEEARRRWSKAARGEVIVIPPSSVITSDCRIPPSEGTYILFAGFIGPSKGLDVLLEAWNQVYSDTTLELVIAAESVGIEDPALERMRLATDECPRPPRWIGFYSSEQELEDGIAQAAAVVLPYRRSSPVSGILVRAMHEGRAVVASAVPAVTTALADGRDGVVVAPGDPRALASGLRAIISDGALRDRLGAAAARRARELFSSERQAEVLMSAYSLLAGRQPQRRWNRDAV